MTAQAISPEANVYLEKAVDALEQNFLRRDKINWQELRIGTRAWAKNAMTFKDTYPAIRWAFEQLQERHSYFLEPQQYNVAQAPNLQPLPVAQKLGKIGYLWLPNHDADGTLIGQKSYQDIVNDSIKLFDQSGVCGWIVNLSQNNGGNMYPMIAGLSALLGNGEHGFFLGAKQEKLVSWGVQAGAAQIGSQSLAVVKQTYQLKNLNAPVAVLISSQTASSGEATAMSFIGRPNTRFFGQATAGFTTGNSVVTLEDGAALVITTAEMADRFGKTHPRILPDQYSGSFTVNLEDHAALQWLGSQAACQ